MLLCTYGFCCAGCCLIAEFLSPSPFFVLWLNKRFFMQILCFVKWFVNGAYDESVIWFWMIHLMLLEKEMMKWPSRDSPWSTPKHKLCQAAHSLVFIFIEQICITPPTFPILSSLKSEVDVFISQPASGLWQMNTVEIMWKMSPCYCMHKMPYYRCTLWLWRIDVP